MSLVDTEYRETISDILDSPAEGSWVNRLLTAFRADERIPVYGFSAKGLHFRLSDPLTPFQRFDSDDPFDYLDGRLEALERAAARTLRLYTHGRRNEEDVIDRYVAILEHPDLTATRAEDIVDLRDNVRSVGNIAREIDNSLDPVLDRIVLVAYGIHPRRSAAGRLASYARQRRDQKVGS